MPKSLVVDKGAPITDFCNTIESSSYIDVIELPEATVAETEDLLCMTARNDLVVEVNIEQWHSVPGEPPVKSCEVIRARALPLALPRRFASWTWSVAILKRNPVTVCDRLGKAHHAAQKVSIFRASWVKFVDDNVTDIGRQPSQEAPPFGAKLQPLHEIVDEGRLGWATLM